MEEKKQKKGFQIDIPFDVLNHITSMGMSIPAGRLKGFVINIANGAGVGYSYYYIDSAIHPKLIRYLADKFDSFNTVLNKATTYAKKRHDSYLGILIASNNLTRVNFERSKFIYTLSTWEQICKSEDMTLQDFETALIKTKNVYEAGVQCGLELNEVLDFKNNSRIGAIIANFDLA